MLPDTYKENKRLLLRAQKKHELDKMPGLIEACRIDLMEQEDFDELGELYIVVVEYYHENNILDKMTYYGIEYMNMVKKDVIPVCGYYHGIASTLAYMEEDFQTALYHVRKEAELHDTTKIRVRAGCLSNIGVLQIMMEDYTNALDSLTDARILLEKCGETESFHGMKCKANLAWVYLEMNILEKSNDYLQEILHWPDIDKMTYLKVELYTQLGAYHCKINELYKAVDFYEEAITTAEEFGYQYELRKLYKYAADAYELMGDYKKSNQYLVDHADLALQLSSRIQQMIRLKAEAELALVEKEKTLAAKHESHLQRAMDKDYDILTSTYSRKYMIECLDELIGDGKVSEFNVLLLRINNSETVANAYGFRSLEQVLVVLGNLLMSKVFDNAKVGRIREDAFIICYETLTMEQVRQYSAHLIHLLKRQDFIFEGNIFNPKVKGGLVSGVSSGAKKGEDLIRLADLALYQAEASKNKDIAVW